MSRLVLLDAGPLGLVTNPRASAETQRCAAWLQGLLGQGVRALVPEIADYEVRRELLRAGRILGVRRLDALAEALGYLPIETAVMRRAADLWALARNAGQPTASDAALDADVILAAQASVAAESGDVTVTVATTNVGHLGRFIDAREWWRVI